jgi:hypothetical protein
MMYVVDSCVAVKWAIAEIDTEKALRVRDDFRAGQRLVNLFAGFPIVALSTL